MRAGASKHWKSLCRISEYVLISEVVFCELKMTQLTMIYSCTVTSSNRRLVKWGGCSYTLTSIPTVEKEWASRNCSNRDIDYLENRLNFVLFVLLSIEATCDLLLKERLCGHPVHSCFNFFSWNGSFVWVCMVLQFGVLCRSTMDCAYWLGTWCICGSLNRLHCVFTTFAHSCMIWAFGLLMSEVYFYMLTL